MERSCGKKLPTFLHSSTGTTSTSALPFINPSLIQDTVEQNTEHLKQLMNRDQILNYARRVGFSKKSFGLEPYLRDPTKTLTVKKAIQLTLNPSAEDLALASHTATTTLGPRGFEKWRHADMYRLNLYDQKLRETKNNWGDLLKVPYPLWDTEDARLQRWGITKYFVGGKCCNIKNKYVGSEGEGQIRSDIQTAATMFYKPRFYNKNSKKMDGAIQPGDSKIDWSATIARTPDLKIMSEQTVEKVMADRACVADPGFVTNGDPIHDTYDGINPNDNTKRCKVGCDFSTFLEVVYAKKTAFLKDPAYKKTGPDGNYRQYNADWSRLKECAKLGTPRGWRRRV